MALKGKIWERMQALSGPKAWLREFQDVQKQEPAKSLLCDRLSLSHNYFTTAVPKRFEK